MRQNITYPLNSQPKLHNTQRSARCLGGSIIITNLSSGGRGGLCRANFDFMDFWALPVDFWWPNEIVFYETYIVYEKHLGAMLFAKNTSKNINTFLKCKSLNKCSDCIVFHWLLFFWKKRLCAKYVHKQFMKHILGWRYARFLFHINFYLISLAIYCMDKKSDHVFRGFAYPAPI